MRISNDTTVSLDEDGHLRGTCKLRALSYLFSQAKLELDMGSEVCHGLA